MSDQHRPLSRWALPARTGNFFADECVDECAFAGAGPAKCRDDEGGFHPNSQRIESIQHSLKKQLAVLHRFPFAWCVAPLLDPMAQIVDRSEYLELPNFGIQHALDPLSRADRDVSPAIGNHCSPSAPASVQQRQVSRK
jgi:hypothetical protein